MNFRNSNKLKKCRIKNNRCSSWSCIIHFEHSLVIRSRNGWNILYIFFYCKLSKSALYPHIAVYVNCRFGPRIVSCAVQELDSWKCIRQEFCLHCSSVHSDDAWSVGVTPMGLLRASRTLQRRTNGNKWKLSRTVSFVCYIFWLCRLRQMNLNLSLQVTRYENENSLLSLF